MAAAAFTFGFNYATQVDNGPAGTESFVVVAHRAMFTLRGKKLFVLCLLVKNVSAVNCADRCNFKESEKAAQHLNRIGGHISSDKAHNSEHFGLFRFLIHVANWQFLIKV